MSDPLVDENAPDGTWREDRPASLFRPDKMELPMTSDPPTPLFLYFFFLFFIFSPSSIVFLLSLSISSICFYFAKKKKKKKSDSSREEIGFFSVRRKREDLSVHLRSTRGHPVVFSSFSGERRERTRQREREREADIQ